VPRSLHFNAFSYCIGLCIVHQALNTVCCNLIPSAVLRERRARGVTTHLRSRAWCQSLSLVRVFCNASPLQPRRTAVIRCTRRSSDRTWECTVASDDGRVSRCGCPSQSEQCRVARAHKVRMSWGCNDVIAFIETRLDDQGRLTGTLTRPSPSTDSDSAILERR
jgi:hypothetical protein